MRWEVKVTGRKVRSGGVGMRWHLPMVNQPVGVHRNSIGCLRKGVVERIFRVKGPDGGLVEPPRPLPGVFEQKMRWMSAEFSRVVRQCRPLSKETFLRTYSGRRKTLYEKAAMAYEQRGVRLSDAKIRAFIKIEALVKLLGDGRLSQEIVPRIIQPRNPRLPVYGYALGRYIKI